MARSSATEGQTGHFDTIFASRLPGLSRESALYPQCQRSRQGYRKVGRPSAPVQEPTGADSKNPDFIVRRSSPEFAVNRISTASSTLRWPCSHARELTLLPENLYLARTAQRVVQQSTEWKQAYQRRAGIEGTISQGVRTCGLRQTRYRGQAKTELQESCVASAINIQRVAAWLAGTSRETTRTSRLLALSA